MLTIHRGSGHLRSRKSTLHRLSNLDSMGHLASKEGLDFWNQELQNQSTPQPSKSCSELSGPRESACSEEFYLREQHWIWVKVSARKWRPRRARWSEWQHVDDALHDLQRWWNESERSREAIVLRFKPQTTSEFVVVHGCQVLHLWLIGQYRT
jgi:hypothetical protein